MLNWHRRSRKTTGVINLLIRECMRQKDKIFGYVAPTFAEAKCIIWDNPEMLKLYLPPEPWAIKDESELKVKFHTGCLMPIVGADKPERIKGQNFHGVVFDEFQRIKKEAWIESVRPIMTEDPLRWAIFSFTPAGYNYAFELWNNSAEWNDWCRMKLPVSESGLLREGELTKARIESPDALYRQEYECDFLADTERVVITMGDLEALKTVSHPEEKEVRELISCDPALGGDRTVIHVMRNTKIVETHRLMLKDPMKIAGELIVIGNKHHIWNFPIDVIGIGSGIVSRLRELAGSRNEIRVIPIQSAEKSDYPEKFYNKRTEMWWTVSQMIRNGEIEYPEDPELRRQLCKVSYDVVDSSGMIKLHPKKETKKWLGCSPDDADAAIYGWSSLKRIHPTSGTKLQNYMGGKHGRRQYTFGGKSPGY